jgi:uncharacterized protein
MEFTTWLAVREAWSLAAKGYAGEPRLTILKQQFRWAFFAIFNSTALLEWFQILQTPELSMYTGINRRIALKPMRVYISHRWKIAKKIKVIRDSYRFIQLFGSPLEDALVENDGVNLARFLFTTEDARLQLGYDNTFRKEGELVVSLQSTEVGGLIVSLAFSFEQQQNGEWTMYIGCIQGRNGIDNKRITKAMHGLWPRVFIVYVAQEIASALGIKHILGVGNAIHSHKKKHIIYIKSRHELSFDYDSLWADVGGELSEDGWFELPLELQRRPYESMKSNKRSMYTRRYAMLDSISTQIQSSLSPQN